MRASTILLGVLAAPIMALPSSGPKAAVDVRDVPLPTCNALCRSICIGTGGLFPACFAACLAGCLANGEEGEPASVADAFVAPAPAAA